MVLTLFQRSRNFKVGLVVISVATSVALEAFPRIIGLNVQANRLCQRLKVVGAAFMSDAMSELIAIDDDGEQQFVWMQEHGDTCGPACVYMIERILRQSSFVGGEERITFLTSLLPDGYHEGRGTQAYTALRQVLDQIGIPSGALHVSNLRQFVSDGFFPFITRVGWTNGGGHFVVGAKTTTSGCLVCLDPWYGLVQPTLTNFPAYSVQEDYRRQKSLLNVVGGTLSGHVIFPNASAGA